MEAGVEGEEETENDEVNAPKVEEESAADSPRRCK